jgi:hypothetical protein
MPLPTALAARENRLPDLWGRLAERIGIPSGGEPSLDPEAR